jgi:hypothetical protein
LRDLISAASNEHEFYCVDEQQVLLYNVKAKEVWKLQHPQLPYMFDPLASLISYQAVVAVLC